VNAHQPAVSVVVATRNRAERLGRLLASLRAQSIGTERFEVIVVDDGSDDGTGALLEREADVLPLRTLVQALPQGPGASRNSGWRLARAPLIAFIDDDCEADPNWLRRGMEAWGGRDDVFVQGATGPLPEEDSRHGPYSYTIRVDGLGPHYETCNIFYPRALLERMGGFDAVAFPGGGEDCDLAWRAIEAGARPEFASEARAVHAVHDLGPMGQLRRAAHWAGTMRVFARHPGMRRAYLHNGVFWQVRHQMLIRVLLALVLPPRWSAVRIWLALPYFVYLRQRARADRASIILFPYYLVHDLIEMAAVIRGAIRFRTLVI